MPVVRRAVARLACRPYFSILVVGLLSGVIAINVVIHTLGQSVLSPALVGVGEGTLYYVYFREPRNHQLTGLSLPALEILADATGVDMPMAGAARFIAGGTLGGRAALVRGELISPRYFDVLQLTPAAGQWWGLHGQDDGVVISHSLWQSLFRGRPDAVGETIWLRGGAFTIVAVAPPGFRGLIGTSILPMDVWAPLRAAHRLGFSVEQLQSPTWPWLSGVLRVPTARDVTAVAERSSTRLRQAALTQEWTAGRVELKNAQDVVFHPVVDRRLTQIALGVRVLAGLALFVVSLNLAGAFWSRARGQLREFAIRQALGATRWRVALEAITESSLIVLTAAAVGVATGLLAATWLGAVVPTWLPFRGDPLHITVPWPNVLTLIGLTGAVCILIGLFPVLQAPSRRIADALVADASGLGRAARRCTTMCVLMMLQVAASTLLMVIAVVVADAARRQQQAAAGFDAEHVAFITLDLELFGYDHARARAFYDAVLAYARVATASSQVGVADWPAVTEDPEVIGLRLADSGALRVSLARLHRVDPTLFGAFGLRVIQGRPIEAADLASVRAVALVDQRTARRYWGDGTAVGQSIRLEFGPMVGHADGGTLYEIVGVVANVLDLPLDQQERDRVYVAFEQHPALRATIYARSAAPPAATLGQLRSAVQAVDPQILPSSAQTGRDYVARLTRPLQVGAALSAVVAMLSFGIAALGIFAVMSNAVQVRKREAGIRMAVGAGRAAVVRTLVGPPMVAVSTGLAAGLLLGGTAIPRLSSLLPDGHLPTGSALVFVGVLVAAAAGLGASVPISGVFRCTVRGLIDADGY